MITFSYQASPACQQLMDDVESTIRHAIVEEEGVPIETVTNFEEVRKNIQAGLKISVGHGHCPTHS